MRATELFASRLMTAGEQRQFDSIVAQVGNWPPALRMALVQRLSSSGTKLSERVASLPPPPRGLSGKEFSEIVDYQGPPPTDEEVTRIIEDALLEKYG